MAVGRKVKRDGIEYRHLAGIGHLVKERALTEAASGIPADITCAQATEWHPIPAQRSTRIDGSEYRAVVTQADEMLQARTVGGSLKEHLTGSGMIHFIPP